MATSPCERVKFQEGHVPAVHDLPGFYPSVEPRHARPETLGPDIARTGNRNPSFAFDLIIRPCGGKVTKIFCAADGAAREEGEYLLDACLALKPAHILHNLVDISGSHSWDFRHIAEFPMVCLDAFGRGSLEGLVPVMVRFIDFVD
jgi:hypothetical protein